MKSPDDNTSGDTSPNLNSPDAISDLLAAGEKLIDPSIPPDAPPPPLNSSSVQVDFEPETAKKTPDEYAKERISQRQSKTEELTTRLTEYETQLALLKTEKETLEARRVELEAAYEGETRKVKEVSERWQKDTDPIFNPDEVPEVQTILSHFHTGMKDFIPADLAGDEEKPYYTNPEELIRKSGAELVKQIDNFLRVESNPGFSPEKRGAYHHAIISMMAKAFGVPDKAFESGDLDGQEFAYLSPRHPVYAHIKARLPNIARSWGSLNDARKNASEKHVESLNSVFDSRVRRSEDAFKAAGITDSLADIELRLKKNPKDPVASVMKLIVSDPEMVKKLNEAIREEAATNASARPHLEVFEPDPKKRDAILRARDARLRERATMAPLNSLSVQVAAKLLDENASLKERLAKYENDEDQKAAAAEPGAAGLRNPSSKQEAPTVAGHDMGELSRILGLLPAT